MSPEELVEGGGYRTRLTPEQLASMMEAAAEAGATRALTRVGLQDDKAFRDVDDLRELIGSWRDLKTEGRKVMIKLLFAVVIVIALALGKTNLLKLVF